MHDMQWIVDRNNFQGYAHTHTTTDAEGVVRVAYSRCPERGRLLTPEEYLALPEKQHLELLTDDEFNALLMAWEKKQYLDKPIQEISAERFWELLEVLPPENWTGLNTLFERFNLSERQTGNIVLQVCRWGFEPEARYFTKYAELGKLDTYLTPARIKASPIESKSELENDHE
ncbi:hypothetical protein PU634_10510 [Oceanimonas pelagia]|uniref:Uncharacterized protein n=1 Tax=Oceanimonas pelagia TaxID=3028314 RepID=A0AA50Q950_9GAMM|nr:hypothetical protein [Oceanimonas pelagia]WMC09548.1 hypothetical protein PU634_10510 [Oceanimonas pelagia]